MKRYLRANDFKHLVASAPATTLHDLPPDLIDLYDRAVRMYMAAGLNAAAALNVAFALRQSGIPPEVGVQLLHTFSTPAETAALALTAKEVRARFEATEMTCPVYRLQYDAEAGDVAILPFEEMRQAHDCLSPEDAVLALTKRQRVLVPDEYLLATISLWRAVQHEMVGIPEIMERDLLPVALKHVTEEDLQKMGYTLGPRLLLFRHAEFPVGWQKVASSGLWYNVLDTHGHMRLKVFYKPDYYDRRAQVFGLCRYSVMWPESSGDTDAHNVVDHVTSKVVFPQTERAQTRDQCVEWLDQNLPTWRSPAAYWPA